MIGPDKEVELLDLSDWHLNAALPGNLEGGGLKLITCRQDDVRTSNHKHGTPATIYVHVSIYIVCMNTLTYCIIA